MKKLIIPLAALVMAGTASAAPVFTGALRDVAVGDNAATVHGGSSPYTAEGSYIDDISIMLPTGDPRAMQLSNIDAANGVFSGEGSADVGFSSQTADGIFAQTFYSVSFDLDTAYNYTLVGSVQVNTDGGLATAFFDLSGPVSFLFEAPPGFGDTDLTSSGVLTAGNYTLLVQASMGPDLQSAPDAFYGGSANFFFNLLLTAPDGQAPVSSPLTLIAIGLLGSLLARRKSLGNGA